MPEAFATRFLDRATGKVVEETVFGAKALQVLYGGRAGRFLSKQVFSRSLPSSIYGWLQRRPSSRDKISGFIRSLGIDASEAEHPLDQYQSLDDFFIRRLKPEARPIDMNPMHLVSPADGRVLVYPCLEKQRLKVKGTEASLEEMLGDAAWAQAYTGGSAIVVRLAPADYHRFHFPDGGTASSSIPVEGRLHSVHPIALASGAPSFRNKRTISALDSKVFGRLTIVEIGALCVGTIIQTYTPGAVRRGQEKGFFRFGGSTVVVFAEEGRLCLDQDLTSASREDLETRVLMGTRIGKCPENARAHKKPTR
jgi:phosphatidylserine decarboxylase